MGKTNLFIFYGEYRTFEKIVNEIKNLNNLVENAKSDFEEASRNYANAVEKESNNEHLSPKEKAIHLLDSITDLLKSFGSSADKVNSKLSELKELLMSILKIASDQSKSFTAYVTSSRSCLLAN